MGAYVDILMALWNLGETPMSRSLTDADAFDSMFDSSALPGSALTDVAREFGENAAGKKSRLHGQQKTSKK
jgi:hypothetical protein